jgi:ribonuclease HI
MAEVLAMLHGLMVANSLGFNDVDAESDSLEVIQLCSSAMWIWHDATAIYADILNQARSIEVVFFSHCGRDTNTVAHELARNCLSSNLVYNWIEEPPSFFLQTLLNDVTQVILITIAFPKKKCMRSATLLTA